MPFGLVLLVGMRNCFSIPIGAASTTEVATIANTAASRTRARTPVRAFNMPAPPDVQACQPGPALPLSTRAVHARHQQRPPDLTLPLDAFKRLSQPRCYWPMSADRCQPATSPESPRAAHAHARSA